MSYDEMIISQALLGLDMNEMPGLECHAPYNAVHVQAFGVFSKKNVGHFQFCPSISHIMII